MLYARSVRSPCGHVAATDYQVSFVIAVVDICWMTTAIISTLANTLMRMDNMQRQVHAKRHHDFPRYVAFCATIATLQTEHLVRLSSRRLLLAGLLRVCGVSGLLTGGRCFLHDAHGVAT